MIRLAAGVAAAKAVGTLARTAGRGGGTSLPGKVLTRVEPHAIRRLAQPADPRQRRDLRHQRQDDDRRDGRLDPRAHRRPAGPQPRGREHGRRDRLRAGQRVPQGRPSPDRRLRPVRGRRVLARPGRRGARAARDAARQPVRDQLDRYGELETIADRWAAVVAATAPALVLNADDPLVADLGRDAKARRRARRGPRPRAHPGPSRDRARRSTSASTTTRSPSPSSSTPATPSTAAAAATPTPTGPSISRTSATTAARTAARSGPTPDVVATDVELRGIRTAAFTLRGRRVELPLPGLYNVYNALAAAALTLSLGVDLDDVVAGLRTSRPRSVAPRRSTSAAARPASCSSRTRPAPTRSSGRWRSRTASSTSSASSTTASRTGATSAGSGTPTGSCSSAACAASRAAGRAQRSWRCG